MAFSAKLMVTLEEKDAEIERLRSELSTARRTALLEALTEAEMIGNRYLASEPDRGQGALDVAHALIAKLEA